MNEFIQVVTTVPSREVAQTLARLLVESRLAACAQISGPIESTYFWENRLENSHEWIVTAKSRQTMYAAIEKTIRDNHPYQVPEIVATPVVAGFADYLEWVRKETVA